MKLKLLMGWENISDICVPECAKEMQTRCALSSTPDVLKTDCANYCDEFSTPASDLLNKGRLVAQEIYHLNGCENYYTPFPSYPPIFDEPPDEAAEFVATACLIAGIMLFLAIGPKPIFL